MPWFKRQEIGVGSSCNLWHKQCPELWGDFLGSRTSSIYLRLLRDCSLTFLEPPTRSLLRARLQFPICDVFTYWMSADACFLSHGCSSRELPCPRGHTGCWASLASSAALWAWSVWLLSTQRVLHSSLSTWWQDRAAVLLTLQKWCLQPRVTATATATAWGASEGVLPSSPGTNQPILGSAGWQCCAPWCPGVLPRCGSLSCHSTWRGWHRQTLPCCQASAGNLVLQFPPFSLHPSGNPLGADRFSSPLWLIWRFGWVLMWLQVG